MHKITSGGLRLHDSIRGPDGKAKRVLVIGHTTMDEQMGGADDYVHISMTEVEELHQFLGEVIMKFMLVKDDVFPRASKTASDDEIYSKWNKNP